jgi:hypothetical protein
MQNIFNDTVTYKEKLFTIILLSKINIQPPNQICTNAITQRRGQVLAGPFSDVTSAAFISETISSLFSYFISAALLSYIYQVFLLVPYFYFHKFCV